MPPTYRDLRVWQKAMQLVTDVYAATNGFPRRETFGITSQMRSVAISVPSNIAEGQGRRLPREFRHFLRTSRGSLLELETQLQIAQKLGYLNQIDAEHLLSSTVEVGRMLNGLIASLQDRKSPPRATDNRQLATGNEFRTLCRRSGRGARRPCT